MIQRSHRVIGRVIGVLGMITLTWLATPVRSAAQEPGTIVARDARVQGFTYVFEATGEEIPYALAKVFSFFNIVGKDQLGVRQ